ncbi:acyl-CoA synthetase [Actinospica sp. MGRD01-02]|uniref:Acyl-CoA synthetase n=1 Tax=Actinospica acidithermotolerans TaxID=2828514 RepID=A0A941EKZ9_9ACTN|nr:acyl-CoA synthetase [Actinospica acidithermotolerans]MBR7829504.1 acyl-CoA synthetase [Actinospica acidithermotolerans]
MELLPGLMSGSADARTGSLTIAGRSLGREALLSAAGAVASRIAGAPAAAVYASASLETAVAVLGGLLSGVPIVPVAPDTGHRELHHVLSDSGAVLVLAGQDEPGVEMASWASCGVPIASVSLSEHCTLPTGPTPGLDGTALVLYTSGTTGVPKGVPVTGRAIAADLDALAEAWAWTPEDTLVHGLPLFHVHGLVLGLLGPLRIGSKLVHTGKPTPEGYARANGSLYFGVPTVWSRITQDPESAKALSGARLLVSGSAALPAPVFERLEGLTGLRPAERYGMTETLITVAARADNAHRRPGAVGKPIRGVETRLVSEEGEALPYDGTTVGELQVRGATVFDGYLRRPEATAASFTEDGWFRTGDMAVIEPDGTHRIVGRASTDLIKSGGYRIGAGEVENALLAHPAVREAAVIGVPDDDLGQRIVAYVVPDARGAVSEQELIDSVARDLSVHKRPRKIKFVDSLPRNAMGKVRKDQLGKH